jgi:hypothetical protein
VLFAAPGFAMEQKRFGARHMYAAMGAAHHGFGRGGGLVFAWRRWRDARLVLFGGLAGQQARNEKAANDYYDPEYDLSHISLDAI